MMCSYCKGDDAEMPHRLCPSCLGRFTEGVPEPEPPPRQEPQRAEGERGTGGG